MTKTCPKCKNENVDDASFCQNCGNNLSTTSKTPQREKTQEGGAISDWWGKQSKRNKTSIGIGGVCCIGLIIIIAIFGMSSPDQTNNTQNSGSNSNNVATPSSSPTWHSIANFSGTGDKTTDTFQIKGNKFRVNLTATTTTLQYGVISFFAYPAGETKVYAGEGSIDNFNQTTQSDSFIVNGNSGSYYLQVNAANLANWNIEIFDYY